ncbi:MAG: phage terminase large subunit [Phycisphaerales bacterium]|nr:phage terminase large subunit [Phycisphaerales bacterium]
MLFRKAKFVLLVSDTEGQAVQFLGDIKIELTENESLTGLFGKVTLIKDSEANIIAQMEDGYQFRIIAKGSEQKVRGLKWRNRRPDLIIGDDLESDEQVMSKDRREKFRNWVYKALLPCGSDTARVRIVGTILHMDSLLERLMSDSSWKTRRFAAHNEDFSEILWPEKFSKERLLKIRQGYIEQGMPEGYSQEYLNYPIDEENAYFRREDFLSYNVEDLDGVHLYYYSAIDFAISDKERADYTVIITVGIDSDNKMYVVDVRRGRWDSLEIIEEMFSVHARYKPEIFTLEAGAIQKAIGAFLKKEMYDRSIFLNLNPLVPVRDKQTRARSIQARMRMGGIYFNKEASWYADLESEMITFPRAAHDDQVDALAWIGLSLDKYIEGKTSAEAVDDVYEEELEDKDDYEFSGRCADTGY